MTPEKSRDGPKMTILTMFQGDVLDRVPYIPNFISPAILANRVYNTSRPNRGQRLAVKKALLILYKKGLVSSFHKERNWYRRKNR